jgi:endonuclease/exonuclease/phosphatase family metal-dependent hydrolase
VLSWNVAIGAGRLDEVLDRLRNGEFGAEYVPAPGRPLVILAQEAYRCDASIPADGGRFHGGRAPVARCHDIAEVAVEHGLSLRYWPSMRNGLHPSDRGNAVLATAALAGAEAIELPHVRQRRVAVAAHLAALPELAFVSAHLDVGGQPRPAGASRNAVVGRFGGGRAHQALGLARRLEDRQATVLGADLNAPFGSRDPAVAGLLRKGFRPAARLGRWRHTFHGPVRLPLDHVLWRSPAGLIREVTVRRLDESARDRRARVFGSDHHPLLALVELAPAKRSSSQP